MHRTALRWLLPLFLAVSLLLVCAAAAEDPYSDVVQETAATWIPVTLNQRLATRTGPGTQYDEPGSFLSAGRTVYAISKAYDSANGIWWVQVEFYDGSNSYRAYTGAKRFSDLNLANLPEESVLGTCYIPRSSRGYYGPSSSYKRIARDVPGAIDVDIIGAAYGDNSCFYQIEFYDSGLRCYRRAWVNHNDCSRDYFYFYPEYESYTPPTNPPVRESAAGTLYLSGNARSVNVRSGPSLSSGIIGILYRGDTAPWLGVSERDSRGVTWYKIKWKDGSGWVSSAYTYVR